MDCQENETSDVELIQRAEELYGEERLLKAAEVLELVLVSNREKLFTEHHWMILKWADVVRKGMHDLLQDPEQDGSPWIKQRETHGHRDFLVFYQLTDENQLIARIDCAFEASLLNPLLSVFNESDLYSSWMPSFKRPIKVGVSKSQKLKEDGRGNQIIQVITSLAWPLYDRDLIMQVMAVDAIEDNCNNDSDGGCIAIQALSQTTNDDPVIHAVDKNAVRIAFSSSMLIRACPPDHPCVVRSKHHHGDNDDEPLILLSMMMEVDPKVRAVPQSIQNFITRTFLGRMWLALLHVAEDVRDGKRPAHKEKIESNRELYDWIEKRVGVMIHNMQKMQKI